MPSTSPDLLPLCLPQKFFFAAATSLLNIKTCYYWFNPTQDPKPSLHGTSCRHFLLGEHGLASVFHKLLTVWNQPGSSPTQCSGPHSAESLLQAPDAPEPAEQRPLHGVLVLSSVRSLLQTAEAAGQPGDTSSPRAMCASSPGPFLQASGCSSPSLCPLLPQPLGW